jgi:hypothetical protein
VFRSVAVAFIVTTLTASIAFHTHPVMAQPAPRAAALHWVRAPGAERCVDGRALARAVESRTGHSVFTSAANAERTLEALIAPALDGWALTVRAWAGTRHVGDRALSFAGANCAQITDTVSLVLALMIDPEACADGYCAAAHVEETQNPTEPPQQPSLPTPQPSAPVLSAPTQVDVPTPPIAPTEVLPIGERPSTTPSSPQTLRPWSLRASFGVAAGTLLPSPSPSLGAELGWHSRTAPVSLHASVTAWVPMTTSIAVANVSGASVSTGGGAFAMEACLEGTATVASFVCGGLLGAVVYGEGNGLTQNTVSFEPGLAVQLRFGVQVMLGERLSLRFTPSLLVPLAWPVHMLTVTRPSGGSVEQPVASPGVMGLGANVLVGWSFGS